MYYRSNPDSPEDDLTLAQIREQLPKGRWRTTPFFEHVSVAVQFQIPYSQFMAYGDVDKATMIAYYRAKSTVEEYEGFLREREAESNRNKPRPARRR